MVPSEGTAQAKVEGHKETGILFFFFFFKILFVYWRVRVKKEAEWGGQRGGEADSLLSREPDVGLYPRIPGS